MGVSGVGRAGLRAGRNVAESDDSSVTLSDISLAAAAARAASCSYGEPLSLLSTASGMSDSSTAAVDSSHDECAELRTGRGVPNPLTCLLHFLGRRQRLLWSMLRPARAVGDPHFVAWRCICDAQ